MVRLQNQAPDERTVETWRAEVRSAFTELNVEPVQQPDFCGSLAVTKRANLQVANIQAGAQRVERTAAAIRRSPTQHLYLVWQREGQGRVEHDGGSTSLSVGDTVLYDPDRPHTLVFTERFAQVCVKVPKQSLADAASLHPDLLFGRRLSVSPGSSRVLSAVTQALLDAPGDDDEQLVADLFFDVLGRGLAWEQRRDQGRDARSFDRGIKMRKFVQTNFRLETLSPADAASALGCSLRQVHAICAALGATFGQLLLAARLEAARHALLGGSPSRIGTIALDCGFTDPSHFARRFRARFGVAPKNYASIR
jgi:AraC-like DNA-binding protein